MFDQSLNVTAVSVFTSSVESSVRRQKGISTQKKKELKFNKNSNFLHLKSFHKGHKDYHPTTWQAKLHIKSTTECQPSILHFNFACNIHDLTNIKICYTDKRHYLWRNFAEVVSLLFNQLIIKWSKLVLKLKV